MMMEQKLDAYVDVSGGDEVEVADVELSQGVLTVTMPQKKGVFVVNKQSPNRCVLDTSCTILCVCVCVDRRRHTYMPPTISLVYGSRKLIHTNHYICVYTCGQADFRHIYIYIYMRVCLSKSFLHDPACPRLRKKTKSQFNHHDARQCRQLWLSSPVSGPSRFEFSPLSSAWKCVRSDRELSSAIESEVEMLLDGTKSKR